MFIERRYLFRTGRITADGIVDDTSDFGLKYSELRSHPIAIKSLQDHFQPITPWENWVFLTKACNLACKYCFEEKAEPERKWSVDELVSFFKWQAKKRNREHFQENSLIVFMGGEPLLRRELIEEIIRKTEGMPFDFGLQTNGTLLDKINDYTLGRLKLLSVSVDGTKEMHDKNRLFKDGKGSYDIVMKNVRAVKERYGGRILPRMTVPVMPDYDFFMEIKSLIDTGLFTDYHWQLETPISRELAADELQAFITNYRSGIAKSVAYWADEIQKGNLLNIIPFETAVKKLIFDELIKDLKADDPHTIRKEAQGMCGFGDRQVYIDLSGKCYPCDTLLELDDAVIGDIWAGVDPRRIFEKNEFFVYGNFKGCARRSIKGIAQVPYARDTDGCPRLSGHEPDFYCQVADGLVDAVKLSIKDILKHQWPVFFSPISEFTECLP